MKKLLMLGGALAGVALLQNKGRRDRLFGQARGMLENAKRRASDLAASSTSSPSSTSQPGRENGLSASFGGSKPYSAFDDSDIDRSRTSR